MYSINVLSSFNSVHESLWTTADSMLQGSPLLGLRQRSGSRDSPEPIDLEPEETEGVATVACLILVYYMRLWFVIRERSLPMLLTWILCQPLSHACNVCVWEWMQQSYFSSAGLDHDERLDAVIPVTFTIS